MVRYGNQCCRNCAFCHSSKGLSSRQYRCGKQRCKVKPKGYCKKYKEK